MTQKILKSDRKNFLNFIAYLQIIGIILVVFGHSFHEYPDGHNGTTILVYRLLYSFRMPLFLFVSGFLMVYTTNIHRKPRTTASRFILNKIKRLLLPMAVLTLLTFMPRYMMSFAADEAVSLDANSFALAFIHSGYMPIPFFWFLHVSFLLLAFTFLFLNLSNRLHLNPKTSILLLLCVFLIYALGDFPATSYLSITELKRLGVFFILGGCYAVFYNDIDPYIPWTRPWFFLLNMAIWAGCFFLFENTPGIYLCSIFGIAFCISFSKIIETRNWDFLDHLKGANYMIFLLSWYFNVIFQQVLAYFVVLPWWVHTLLSLTAGIYVPWLGYKYLEKHQDSAWVKCTAFLLGQSFKNIPSKIPKTVPPQPDPRLP